MKIDLHIHTTAFSSCSRMTPDEMMTAALKEGLDGVCLTEHNRIWPKEDADALGKKYEMKIFRGMEVTTTGGDILVFGLDEEPQGLWTPAHLKSRVDAVGGVAVAAHPFRGFLLFGFGSMELGPGDLADNPTFRHVHGLEVCNGLVTDEENELARKAAQELNLIMIGGSDAHKTESVGTYVTDFIGGPKDEKDLVTAILTGQFSIIGKRIVNSGNSQ